MKKSGKTKKKVIFALMASLVWVSSTPIVSFAEYMTSTNYRAEADALGIGGGHSTSASYIATDTLGEMATGEDLSSASYQACAGLQCFQSTPFLSFTLTQGLTPPGTASVGVDLGVVSPAAVSTSNGTTINSIFITLESNASGGSIVTVRDENAGLKRLSTADLIDSSTETLAAGNEGFGLCVFSATEDGTSPTTFDPVAPFAGTCTKTTGHDVGGLTTSPQDILASTGELAGGSSEILVKASTTTVTAAGDDYNDTLTFIVTSTY